jgi:hypothetical protein
VSYRVIWEDVALAQLDEIWKTSHDRDGIQNTATRISTELTYRPLEAGESRSRNYRVLFKYPLVVWYRVVERLSYRTRPLPLYKRCLMGLKNGVH